MCHKTNVNPMKISKYTILILYTVMVALLGYATFVGQLEGASCVSNTIYGTTWFFVLWGILVVAASVYIVKSKLYKRLALFMLHASFCVILLGAAVTFLFADKGKMHIRQGETVNFYVNSGQQVKKLPFSLTLKNFEIRYYPGTTSPSDFVSRLSLTREKNCSVGIEVSMNNIHQESGYRLYQNSFDEDLKGTVLSVNYDPWGIGITYMGYIMLVISMISTLLVREETFRRLLSSSSLRRSASILILMLMCLPPIQARSIPTINKNKVQQVARYQVIYNDRIVPFNTVSIDFMVKVYGKKTYKGLLAEQVLYGWMLKPEVWKQEKMLKIKSRELRERLGIAGKYASMDDLFDANGQYRLLSLVRNEPENSPLGKSMRELDEKVGLILMLINRTLFNPLGHNAPHLGSRIIEAEIFYNRLPFTKISFIANLSLGFLTLLFLLLSALCGKPLCKISRSVTIIGSAALYLSFAISLLGYVLRWYIGGRIPLSNGYETMLLLALIIMLVTIFLYRRFVYALPFGFLLSGLALLVSHLGQMSPQITQLVPVLQSPLLSIHVSLIMASYALFAFMMLNGTLACILILKNKKSEVSLQLQQLTDLSRLMLYPACFMLSIGIFLGAVWANVSWGAYWSWDPKETWALITLMVYAVAFHGDTIPFFKKDLYFHLYLIFAFLTVLMTYFGVNFFMSGMHSYA